MGEGYAWVTLATNDSYSLGALVLAHSLKQVGTGHQLAVLVTPGVTTAMREKLAAVFNLVQEVNVLDSKDETNLRLLKRPELGITFTKLHCWRLTQFDKCVFLDADALVLQHCDELFDREELSAAPDVGWPDCFNTGVFVYRPSNETYEKLVQFALEKGSFDGGDQGLLNLYFSDWATKDISKHLPFIYNLCSTACYSYLPAFKQFGLNAKIIHFIGSSKPWLQYFNTETRTVQPSEEVKHLQGALQYWWNIFCSVIHPQLTTEMTGLAGAFAQLTLGAPRTAEQSALDDHLRRQGWETGNIDYMGRDSFDNIWSKICETLTAGLPSPPTSPPEKTTENIKLSELTQDSTIPSSLTPSGTSESVSETAQDHQSKTIPGENITAENVLTKPQVEILERTAVPTSETESLQPARVETEKEPEIVQKPSVTEKTASPQPVVPVEIAKEQDTIKKPTEIPVVEKTESLQPAVPVETSKEQDTVQKPSGIPAIDKTESFQPDVPVETANKQDTVQKLSEISVSEKTESFQPDIPEAPAKETVQDIIGKAKDAPLTPTASVLESSKETESGKSAETVSSVPQEVSQTEASPPVVSSSPVSDSSLQTQLIVLQDLPKESPTRESISAPQQEETRSSNEPAPAVPAPTEIPSAPVSIQTDAKVEKASTVPSDTKPSATPESEPPIAPLTKSVTSESSQVTPPTKVVPESPLVCPVKKSLTTPKSTTTKTKTPVALDGSTLVSETKTLVSPGSSSASVTTKSTTPASKTKTPVPSDSSTPVIETKTPVSLESTPASVTTKTTTPVTKTKTPLVASESSTPVNEPVTPESPSAAETEAPVTPESSAAVAVPKSKAGAEPAKPTSKVKADPTAAAAGASPTPPPRKAGTGVKKPKAKK